MRLRRLVLAFALPLLAAGCGGDSSPTAPDPGEPVPTDPGDPVGSPASATIGAAGGSLASADGRLTLTVPAGALAADTEITVQALTNTAWGGVGAAYRLTPHGLTFSTPVSLELAVPDEALEGGAPEFLDVVVQGDDGLWRIFRDRTWEADASTLTVATSHFSDYSVIEGIQIRPGSASVPVSGTVDLHVRLCQAEPLAPDEELSALVYLCDEELAALGTFSNWSVNGVPGGNSTFGRVAEVAGSSQAVRYTAPAASPPVNPVAVSVQASYGGVSAILVANITITDDWTGTASLWFGNNEHAEVVISWHKTATYGDYEFFEATGTVTYTQGTAEEGCLWRSEGPDSGPIGVAYMQIDHSADPATFAFAFEGHWDAIWCAQCNEDPEICEPTGIGASLSDKGEVSADGRTISSYVYDPGTDTGYTYEFTKGGTPKRRRS